MLCLNDKVLALRNATGAVIHVAQGSTFTLLDCGAGKITHSGSAGGQGVLADGTFYMYGVTIRNCEGVKSGGENAGGVEVTSTGSFHMLGGMITKNSNKYQRGDTQFVGGVYVANGGSLTLSRGAEIGHHERRRKR